MPDTVRAAKLNYETLSSSSYFNFHHDNQFDQKVHRSPYRQAVHRAHEDQGRVQLHCITKHTNTNRQTVQPDD